MNRWPGAERDVRVDVLADDQVLLVHMSGAQGLDDLRSMHLVAPRHPDYAPTCGVIYDFTDADVEAVTSDDLRIVVEDLKRDETRGRHRVALVVPHDLSFGLARVFEVFARLVDETDGRARHITRELDDALAWMRETRPS